MNKTIKVLLRRQVLQAYEGTKLTFEFDCATGDRNHPTMPGRFHVLRKHRTYTSKKYQVPMDFAMFFSHDGKAIHKSNAVGPISYLKWCGIDYFGSHGCVRLAEGDARSLFDWTPMGTPVVVSQ